MKRQALNRLTSLAQLRAERPLVRTARFLGLLLILITWSVPAIAATSTARHKPGAITMRGVVVRVNHGSITVQTTTHGTLSVSLHPQTRVAAKGGGAARLEPGAHIGVHGFLSGSSMSAISVVVYPVKPKAFSVVGVVQSGSRGAFVLTSSRGRLNVRVSASTTITSATGAPGKSGALLPGTRVRARLVSQSGSLIALSIHLYAATTAKRHGLIRGSLVGVTTGAITVRVPGGLVRIMVTHGTATYVGASAADLRALRPGSQVTVHTCCQGASPVALSIHESKQSPGRHVRLVGTLLALGSRLALQSAGHRYSVRLTSGTRVFAGHSIGGGSLLRVGQRVTVYACCSSGALTATSIHVSSTRQVHVRTRVVHGTIVSISGSTLRVRTSQGILSLQLQRQTVFSAAAGSKAQAAMRPGATVTVRVTLSGTSLRATRVYVHVVRVRTRSVVGIVTAIAPGRLTLQTASGKTAVAYTAAARVQLGGRPILVGALRPGDLVRVRVAVQASGGLSLVNGTVRRPLAKPITLQATLVRTSGSTLVVADHNGVQVTIVPARGVVPMVGSTPAPMAAEFPGARVRVRGFRQGGNVLASAITLRVTRRVLDASVVQTGPTSWQVTRGRGASGAGSRWHIDLMANMRLTDRGVAISPRKIVAGSLVKIDGYDESAHALRASAVSVLHPTVEVVGVVVRAGSSPLVRTSTGVTYTVHVAAQVQIALGREQLAIRPVDLPVGAHVHAEGTVRTDGGVDAVAIDARIALDRVRARVSQRAPHALDLATGSSVLHVRVPAASMLSQGSRSLALTDVVVGDDVTVEGYRLADGSFIATRVDVHRKLIAVQGTIQTMETDGFTLSAGASSERVVISPDTAVSGGSAGMLAPGVSVHVTGYLRGDATILAKRIRILPTKKAP